MIPNSGRINDFKLVRLRITRIPIGIAYPINNPFVNNPDANKPVRILYEKLTIIKNTIIQKIHVFFNK